MKSIQTKFIVLITTALMTLVVFVGGFSLWNAGKVMEEDSAIMMNSVCAQQAIKLDNQLERIEQAVTIIYQCADKELAGIDDLSDLEARDAYTNVVRTLAIDIANHTDGARAVYFRYDPFLTDGTSGFFWSRKGEEEEFTYDSPTDLSVYERDDMEHVGWFWQPVTIGNPMWTNLYYNKNIDVEMISYIIPFYKHGKLVGVIGMDIDFPVFLDLAQQTTIYETGRANLVDMKTKQIYYYVENESGKEIQASDLSAYLYTDLLVARNNGDELLDSQIGDVAYKMSFKTLRNDMKFILYAPDKEIREQRNNLLLGILILAVAILAVFLAFTIYMTKRIIRPLKQLTEAAKQMAEGDLEVAIANKSNDEIGTLTDSINVMAGKLKVYVEEVNALAYKDGLTGVKNKTCYIDYVEKLGRSENPEYAVVLFDVNNLKILNDNYGHEAGDELLKMACTYICNVFTHSPVFRIGGDEFVAILQGADYEQYKELIAIFEVQMKGTKLPIRPYEELSVAFGMAIAKEGESYEDVFRRADQAMYEKKREMKQGQAPR